MTDKHLKKQIVAILDNLPEDQYETMVEQFMDEWEMPHVLALLEVLADQVDAAIDDELDCIDNEVFADLDDLLRLE